MCRIRFVLAFALAVQFAHVATSPIDKARAAACTEKVYVGDSGGGIAISQDAGESWGAFSYPSSGASDSIYSIYALGDNIYAGTYFGAAASENNGGDWTVQGLNPQGGMNEQIVNSVFAIKERVWAGVTVGPIVSISDDNGQTWPISSVLPSIFSLVNAVTAIGSRTFVGTDKGLGISDDDGTTWQYVGQAQGLADDYVGALAVDGNTVYAGSDYKATISISEDGGQTWRIQNSSQSDQNDVAYSIFAADGKVYVGRAKGGLAISEDGGSSWVTKTMQDGLPSNTIHSIAAVGNNVYVTAAVNDGSLSVSRDGGQTWTNIPTGSPSGYLYAVFAQCV